MKKTVVLAILDGWGIGRRDESNAIYLANPETVQWIEANYPAGALNASGVSIGLPWNEEGNSEVGHLTLGAGRVLEQHYLKITGAIERGEFFKNKALQGAFEHAQETGGAVHLIGLLTDTAVHASLEHLSALLRLGEAYRGVAVYLHLFTDGRDTSPKAARQLLGKLEEYTARYGVGTVASIGGRYYGMDRNENWDRTEVAYRAIMGKAEVMSIDDALQRAYDKGLSDEYVYPVSVAAEQGGGRPVKDGDAVIFFNFREDRMRQLSAAFIDPRFSHFAVEKPADVYIALMTDYYSDQKKMPGAAHVAFSRELVRNTLGEVLANSGMLQLRVAETEKYAHVTYFFNGLREKPFENEYRILIPSSNARSYADEPAMQAKAITDRLIVGLGNGIYDFILCNYANADMVGHTGNVRATVEAVRVVDAELNRLVRAVLAGGHVLVITADHGNAETVFNTETGEPDTRHNANPVPLYIVGEAFQGKKLGETKDEVVGLLSDVAPTVLSLLELAIPPEMTGTVLL